ncbi:MAG TPA: hypothetical protein PKA63_03690 [Oligoflexia bacterium]|nr:hypothetical protein [Oligoflexia bacterium]HMP47757.1 hypothetical protein [Oligoflexia bacterium]
MKSNARKLIRASFFLPVFFFFACSASGPSFHETSMSMHPVRRDVSRVYFLRPSRSVYSGSDARITANGMSLGKIPNKGFIVEDLPPGHYNFRVDQVLSPGSYHQTQRLRGGKSYYAVISPQGNNVLATALLGPLGQIGHAAINDGVFEMVFVTKEQAMQHLPKLRFVGGKRSHTRHEKINRSSFDDFSEEDDYSPDEDDYESYSETTYQNKEKVSNKPGRYGKLTKAEKKAMKREQKRLRKNGRGSEY